VFILAVLEIVTYESSILRKKAREVIKISRRLRDLAKNMLETMHSAKGLGLAAPQVGVLERLIVIDVGDGPVVLFNPRIISKEGDERDIEGCLSIPGRNEYINRAKKVTVSGMNLEGKSIKLVAADLLARALQHEIDHLDGILFIDYVSKEK
jgi:peptide deformylase